MRNSGTLMLSSQISQKIKAKNINKMIIKSKEPKTEILLSVEFSKLRNSIRSHSMKSHFSQKKNQINRSSTGKKFLTLNEKNRINISPKKTYNNESKVIRSKSFHPYKKSSYRMVILSKHKTKKITSKIYKEKHQRLLIKLKSFLFFCKFINKTPKDILGNKDFFPSFKNSNSRSKWFFISIKKGIFSEVKSLLRLDPYLIYQKDRVSQK